jgi:hypothetical protein
MSFFSIVLIYLAIALTVLVAYLCGKYYARSFRENVVEYFGNNKDEMGKGK